MPWTDESRAEYRRKMIARYGSAEAVTEHRRKLGHKGGTTKKSAPSGFAAMTVEKRRAASIKGGTISRRGPKQASNY